MSEGRKLCAVRHLPSCEAGKTRIMAKIRSMKAHKARERERKMHRYLARFLLKMQLNVHHGWRGGRRRESKIETKFLQIRLKMQSHFTYAKSKLWPLQVSPGLLFYTAGGWMHQGYAKGEKQQARRERREEREERREREEERENTVRQAGGEREGEIERCIKEVLSIKHSKCLFFSHRHSIESMSESR